MRLHREWRRRLRSDDGFSAMEMVISLVIVGIVAAAFLSLSVSSVSAARTNEQRTAAVQLAQDKLEDVVAQPWAAIGLYASDSNYRATTPGGESTVTLTTSPRPASVPVPYTSIPVNGVSYSIRTDISWYDDSADGTGSADSTGSSNDMKHIAVTVGWTQGGQSRSVSVDDLRAATATEVPPTTTSTTTVTVSAPSSQQLTTSGYLASTMTVSATTSKSMYSATVSFPTRTGTKTVSMTSSSNGTVWTVALPTTTGPFDTGATTFTVAAAASSVSTGTASTGSATVQLQIGTGSTVSVSAAPGQQLASNGALSTAISVTATGSTTISSASMTYPTHSGTVTRSLSGSGTSWSYTVPVDGVTVFDSGTETFTITVVFANNTTATGLASVTLYAGILPPDVTGLVVSDPWSTTGNQSFCISSSKSTLYKATNIDATVANVATTDTVKLTVPSFPGVEFTMSYVSTNTDGSMIFRYTVPTTQTFPSVTSITLQAYALKTISGSQYRDDYVTSPAPTVQSVSKSSSCT